MNAVLVNMGRGTGIVLGLLLATASYGQAPMPAPIPAKPVAAQPIKPVFVEQAPKPAAQQTATPGAHRMQITTGLHSTVQYFDKGLAPTEVAAIRDLERAENEASYAETMASLRQLYLNNELNRERSGELVQTARNTTTVTTYGSGLCGAVGSPLQMGYAAIPNNYALVANPYATVYPNQYAYNRLYPNVYTPGYWGDGNFGGTVNTVENVQYGVGDDSKMKQELFKSMATQYTPETVAGLYRSLDTARSRVMGYPRVREALGQSDPSGIAMAGYGPVTLTLKDGKELKGNLQREDADWLYVQTDNEDLSIRKADVSRTARPRPQK
jgi:hypothetical protein